MTDFKLGQELPDHPTSNTKPKPPLWRRVIRIIWRFIRGTALAAGFIWLGGLVFSLVLLAGMASPDEPRKLEIKDNSVLYFDLDYSLHDGDLTTRSPLPGISLPWVQKTPSTTLLARNIINASQDPRIEGMILRLTDIAQPITQIDVLREALITFRQTGKPIYAYADSLGGLGAGLRMGTSAYYLLSAATEFWVHPLGSIGFFGAQMETPYLRDTLAKIGIEAEILQQGDYKTSAESFARNEMSSENRRMTTRLIGRLNGYLVEGVAENRLISMREAETWLERGYWSATDALMAKMIDGVGDLPHLIDWVEEAHTTTQEDFVPLMAYHIASDYDEAESKDLNPSAEAEGTANAPLLPSMSSPVMVARIAVDGAILAKSENPAIDESTLGISANLIGHHIRRAAENEDIDAIVVAINSPGGTPVGADIIHRAILDARAHKPVIAVMRGVAASGGYWLATAADAIITAPTTMTGSIGVFMAKPNLQGLWEKIGLNWQTITYGDTNPQATPAISLHRPLSPTLRRILEQDTKRTYQAFINRVVAGRNLSTAEAEAIAQGQVWLGMEAVEIGLADIIGNAQTAKDLARIMTQSPEGKPVVMQPYPARPPLWQLWLKQLGKSASLGINFGAWLDTTMIETQVKNQGTPTVWASSL